MGLLKKLEERYKAITEGVEDEDGWGLEEDFNDLLTELDNFSYEIRMCVRGANTGAKTYAELADYMRTLASNIESKAEDIEKIPENNETNNE